MSASPIDVARRPDSIPAFVGWGSSSDEDLAHHAAHPAEIGFLSPRATPRRRSDFTIGRLAARRALESIGADVVPVPIGPAREPLWPDGMCGSIAHARGLAVAVVATLEETDGVGVDVESMVDVPELAGHVPRPEEQIWLDRLEHRQKMAALISLFSAKETLYKAFYPRVEAYFGFEAASLRPVKGGYDARLVEPLDPAYPESRPMRVNCRWSEWAVVTWLILPRTDPTS